jgi:hypothetical protein
MKWRKLGQIFDFYKSPFKKRYLSHAQSPQVVVYDDYIRVYFSTRVMDKTGKFLSHIQYVDYNEGFKEIINYSRHEVIPLGNIGCFDEHGIFPISPMLYQDKFYAYTSGWTRRISVDVDSGIGFSISSDNGRTFKKMGDGPILSSSLNEPFLVADPFVRFFNKKFYMFYISGVKWIQNNVDSTPERVYKISYAISDEGIVWQKIKNNIIENKIGENECQALPSVIKINNCYHMFFCYRSATDFRKNKDKAYRIGYAYSDNLDKWTRNDDQAGIGVSENGWDSDMQCYPHVFNFKNKIYMLYNGNKFGRNGFGISLLED